MKKILLSLMAVAMVSMSASAATKIYVCGTKITGSTSFSAGGGTVSFDNSNRILTISNVSYTKTGSSNNGISVDDVDGPLTINLVGSVKFDIKDADAVLCKSKKATTINVSGFTELYCRSSSHACIKLQDGDVTVEGSGRLDLRHNNSGHTTMGGAGTENLTLGIFECNMYGNQSKFHKLHYVEIERGVYSASAEYSTMIYLQNWNDTPIFQATDVYSFTVEPGASMKLLEPIELYNSPINNLINSITCTYASITDLTPAVIVNSNYVPDANLRNRLLDAYVPNGYLTTSEMNARTYINVSGYNIYNMEGIQQFTNLKELNCSNNNLTSVNWIPKTLENLNISGNKFTSINLSSFSKLSTLNCSNNQIAFSDPFSVLPTSLTYLNCAYNKITNLDFCGASTSATRFDKLAYLDCSYNPQLTVINNDNSLSSSHTAAALSTLIFTGCTSLTQINCENNKLTSLSSLPSSLKSLNVSSNLLTSLPSLPSGLEYLIAFNNILTSFSLSNHSNIKRVRLDANPLTTATVANNSNLEYCGLFSIPSLTTLKCYGNPKLKNLYSCEDLTGLKTLECYSNALTSLDVSNCKALTRLDCHDNQLTSLTVQGLNSLSTLEIYGNKIKESAMGTLVNSLRTIPAGSSGEFKVLKNSGEGNVITNAQVRTARNKRWLPKKQVSSNWVEIPVSITGDVNGDGYVTSADVTAVYDVMLGTDNQFASTADVNGDGYVTSADVTAIYDIMLGGQ